MYEVHQSYHARSLGYTSMCSCTFFYNEQKMPTNTKNVFAMQISVLCIVISHQQFLLAYQQAMLLIWWIAKMCALIKWFQHYKLINMLMKAPIIIRQIIHAIHAITHFCHGVSMWIAKTNSNKSNRRSKNFCAGD